MEHSAQKSIVVLGSGQGSTIEFFCQQIYRRPTHSEEYPILQNHSQQSPRQQSHCHKMRQSPFHIKAIITDNPKSRLLKIAQNFNIPCHVLSYDKHNPSLWDKNLCRLLSSYDPSLIVLAGFLKKIGPKVIKKFPNKIINSHPSLLPEFGGAGFYGLKVHRAVLSAGRRKTGISIHLVNSEYDKGRVLAQLVIPIKEKESAEELAKRVKAKEKPFYLQTIETFLRQHK